MSHGTDTPAAYVASQPNVNGEDIPSADFLLDSVAKSKRAKEVFLTQEEAKKKKLQKGYVLEPIVPKDSSEAQPVSAKRERKRSYHFGHSPEEDDEGSRAGHSDSGSVTHRVRPKPSASNGLVKGGGAAVAAGSNLPSHWLEKRKALQARLRRLDDQLAVVRARSLGMAASPFGPSRAATPPTEVPRLSRPPAVWPTYAEGGFPMTGDRRGADSMMPTAAKRKASFERVRNVEPKRQRGGADGKWENRLVPNGRMRNAFQHCSKLLDTLMRDRGSKAYFNAPVDYVALGIPQYPQIIAHPMDLGTVKQKLDEGDYESVEAWAEDIRLVWSNATTFNCQGNDVHECAKALGVSFEKMLKQFPKIAGAPGGPAAAPGGGAASLQGGGGRQVLELKRTMEKLQQELASLKGKPAPAAATPAKKKAPGTGGGGRKAMSFDEKRNLSLNINKLDNDKLIKVVDIIRKRKGHMVGQTEEVEIDIDALDTRTLRELDKYVNQCLNPAAQPPSRKAARPPGSAPARAGPVPPAGGGPASGPAGWAGAQAAESSGSDSDSDSDFDSDKEGLVASGAWDGTARPGYSAAGGGQNT